MWTPPRVPPNLKPDSDDYFRDPNAARWPRFPIEPAIRAVFAQRPQFDATDVAVVGCGNTMGNLLRFLESSDRTFSFNIEVIGSTVFMIRKGTSSKELIPDVYGYGHTFPEAYTSWDEGLQGSVSHQRLVKYRFGEINCLVRFESDGYLREKVVLDTDPSPGGIVPPELSRDSDISSLVTMTDAAFVSEKFPVKGLALHVEVGGREIPQSAIFDLKTRSIRKDINMDEIYPRLWLSQIPNFIVAYHASGQFTTPQPREVVSDLQRWEMDNNELLALFHTTLRQLIKAAKDSKARKVEVRRSGTGPLEIRTVSEHSWSALPRDLKAKWAGYSDKGDGTSDAADQAAAEYDEEDDEEDEDDAYLNF